MTFNLGNTVGQWLTVRKWNWLNTERTVWGSEYPKKNRGTVTGCLSLVSFCFPHTAQVWQDQCEQSCSCSGARSRASTDPTIDMAKWTSDHRQPTQHVQHWNQSSCQMARCNYVFGPVAIQEWKNHWHCWRSGIQTIPGYWPRLEISFEYFNNVSILCD